ncbi:hypothetical protein D3C72_1905900 [compost metagenome]
MGDSLDAALAVALEHLDELEQRVIAGAAAEQEVDLAALLNGAAPARSHGHDH